MTWQTSNLPRLESSRTEGGKSEFEGVESFSLVIVTSCLDSVWGDVRTGTSLHSSFPLRIRNSPLTSSMRETPATTPPPLPTRPRDTQTLTRNIKWFSRQAKDQKLPILVSWYFLLMRKIILSRCLASVIRVTQLQPKLRSLRRVRLLTSPLTSHLSYLSYYNDNP